MKMIKNELPHNCPKGVVASKVEGVMQTNAPGELPRGKRQVINIKCTLKFNSDDGMDKPYSIMQQAKIHMPVTSRRHQIQLL